MKIKRTYLYSAGAVAGIILGFFIPKEGFLIQTAEVLSHGSISLIRYLLFPLLFLSLAIAVTQLRREKALFKVLSRSVLYLLGFAVVFSLLSIILTLIIGPERVQSTTQISLDYQVPTLLNIFNSVFPRNLFNIFIGGNSVLLPLLVLSFALGFHLFFDREIAEPAFNFFDSMSRILYRMNEYMLLFGSILIIPIAAYTVSSFRTIENLNFYGRLLIVSSAATVMIVFLLIPGILFLFNRRENPFKTLLKYLSTALSAFLSGDMYFTTLFSLYSAKDQDGIPRRVTAPVLSLTTLFSRSGTAVISAISMLFILRSYSALELTFFQIFWVFAFSILVSFLSFHTPSFAVYLSMAVLCGIYGRGLENGYQDLIPVLPLLNSFAVFIDSLAAVVLNHLVSRHQGDFHEIPFSESF